MSRYDGLIIPRSYSEYINKTDAATLQQALQLSGVLSGAVAAGDNKAVKSNAVYGVFSDLAEYIAIPYLTFDSISKVWTWNEFNIYNTSKPLKNGQLVAIFLEKELKEKFWYGDTTGVVTLSVQNTNNTKSADTKCIGVKIGSYIDIIV